MKKLVVLVVLTVLGVAPMAAAHASVAFTEGDAPVVSGTGHAGEPLTATSGDWSRTPDTLSYEWLVDGEGAVVGRDASYTPTAAEVGEDLVVVVTATVTDTDGTQSAKNSSAPVTVLPARLVAPAVRISGSATVHGTLRATYVTSGTAGANVTQVWTQDGREMPDQTGSTYTVSTADAGHRIAFEAISTIDDGPTLASSSTAYPIPARNVARPTISGTAKVHKKLKVRSRGTWYGAGYAYTYQWLRNGKSISGARKSTYTLATKDKGRKISLRVTARKSGFATVTASSASSAKVKKK